MATEYRYCIPLPRIEDLSNLKERRINAQVQGEGSPRVSVLDTGDNAGFTDWIDAGLTVTITTTTVDDQDQESEAEQTLGPFVVSAKPDGLATYTEVVQVQAIERIIKQEMRNI